VINPGAVRSDFESTDGRMLQEVADAIAFAATRKRSSVSGIDINNRSKFADDF
jgi:hypothetical protein